MRKLTVCLLALVCFLLLLALGWPTVCRVHEIPIDKAFERAYRANKIEIHDIRDRVILASPFVLSDSNKVISILKEIKNSPGVWKKGSFPKTPDYISLFFMNGNDPLLILSLGKGYLIRGHSWNCEYKFISSDIESLISSLDTSAQSK